MVSALANPFRNVKLHWRRLMNRRVVELDGIKVSTDAAGLPRSVRSALFKETYEVHERRLVRQIVRPGDRVLEIGAGIGVVASLAARLCGPGNLVSYEANSKLEPIIRGNFALNGVEPRLVMRAVNLDGRPVTFNRDDNIVSSSLAKRDSSAEAIEVAADAFDDIVRDHRPGIVIMDVEGIETDLLSQGNLEGVAHIVVEIHPQVTGQEAIDTMLARLEGLGFAVAERAHKTLHLVRETSGTLAP